MNLVICICQCGTPDKNLKKFQCMNNWILTDSPLFLKQVSLLHQNASLVLKNISNSLLKNPLGKNELKCIKKSKLWGRCYSEVIVQLGTCTSVFCCLCCPCFVFEDEAAKRNFSGGLNPAKKVAWNQALGRRGENCSAGRWATEGRQEIYANKNNEVWFVSMVQKCVWRWV